MRCSPSGSGEPVSQPVFDFFSSPRIRPTDIFSVTQLLLIFYRIHIMFVLCSSELDFKAIQMPGTHIVVTECTTQPRLSSLAFYKLKFICVNQGTTACTDKNHIYIKMNFYSIPVQFVTTFSGYMVCHKLHYFSLSRLISLIHIIIPQVLM